MTARSAKARLEIPAIIDNRSPFIIAIHGSGAYRLPCSSRDQMIADILAHPMRRTAGEGLRFCWDIRMNFPFNTTGVVEGGDDVCATQNSRWSTYVKNDPDVLLEAYEKALSPYLASDFSILDDPDMRCRLTVDPDADGWLVMEQFAGIDLAFEDAELLAARLSDAEDDHIANLWAALRVMDEDTSRPMRAFAVSLCLNELRARIEAEWLDEVESELNF